MVFLLALYIISDIVQEKIKLGADFMVEQIIKGLLLIMGVAVVTIYRRKTLLKGRKMKYE